MSLLTTAYLMERYGPLLNEEQLGEVLHISGKTVLNKRALGTLGIGGIKEGKRVLFHASDVAAHIEMMRQHITNSARDATKTATCR